MSLIRLLSDSGLDITEKKTELGLNLFIIYLFELHFHY